VYVKSIKQNTMGGCPAIQMGIRGVLFVVFFWLGREIIVLVVILSCVLGHEANPKLICMLGCKYSRMYSIMYYTYILV